MLKRLSPYIILLLTFLFPVASSADLLLGPDYSEAVSKYIDSAERSIVVAMYFIISSRDESDPVDRLIDSLIRAKRRGVFVLVVLEDSKFSENRLAFMKLKDALIDVHFDSPSRLMHMKAVVIDDRFVFLGSANWSRQALWKNYEATLFIDSAPDALILKNYINSIAVQTRDPLSPIADGVEMPASFLLSPKGLRQLITNDAPKQFDLYVILFRKMRETGSRELVIDYDSLAIELGYSIPSNLGGYRDAHNYFYERVHRSLKKLKNYDLIDYDNGIVRMPDIVEGERSFLIPHSYWTIAKDKGLSLRAKYMYLIALYEASKSTKYPSWFRSQADMSKLYGISDTTISLGLLELEEKGIIKVARDKLDPSDFSNRNANVYTMQ